MARQHQEIHCPYHETVIKRQDEIEKCIKNTVPWKVFVLIFGLFLTAFMAYIGWADIQSDKAVLKAEKAIERTYQNREELVRLSVMQSATLKNLEKLLHYYGLSPEVTSEQVEEEIKNGKDR